MTAVVRCFAIDGLVQIPIASSAQLATNSSYVLKFPYLANETLSVDSAVSSSESLSANPYTRALRVEVDDGAVVHFEVSPKGAPLRTATTDSPTLEGKELLTFGAGWVVSFLEKS
ncbi:hypothetical protein [Filomicrobium sp.]|uniref:hypothetical protein n=1 Tax=Filomicrobium sp. TaxID=2024831 RepID=UPI002582838B|nr:hypothetical protein [Filomicrobium sp.]MCV0371737.1 hypothetical protein [Filomicrobium sp.]